MVRPSDVPTYVQYGAADAGIAGKDVLLEHGSEGLYQPVDLGIGRCRMVVATRRSFDWAGTVQRGARIRVATKYVKTAREHFAQKGMHVDVIRLYGSMELAPLVGLADVIVDLVSTGNTLRANDLVAVEDIMPISSRLIVNPGALKLKRAEMQPLIDALARAVPPRAHDLARHPLAVDGGPAFASSLDALIAFESAQDPAVDAAVAAIIADVRARGDEALVEYTRRFDRLDVASVPALEVHAAPTLPRRAMRCRASSAMRSSRPSRACGATTSARRRRGFSMTDEDGSELGQRITPLDRVGIYVPAARPPIRRRC